MNLLLPALIASAIGFATCLAIVALGRALHRSGSAGQWAVPLGLGAGYALGHAWLRGWLQGTPPPWPPVDGYDWLAVLAAALAIPGALDVAWPTSWWSRLVNSALAISALLWCLLSPLLAGFWTPEEGPRWLVGLGAGTLVVWILFDAKCARLGRAAIAPAVLWAIATAICMQLCHSLILAELAGVLAAALIALWIVSRWSPDLSLARGAVPVVVTLLAGLILYARFYGYPELPAASAIALAAAPVVLWIDELPPIRGWSLVWRTLTRYLALLVPLGLAIGFALPEFLKAGVEGY